MRVSNVTSGKLLSLAAVSRVHPFCNFQSWERTHFVLVIGQHELLDMTLLIEPHVHRIWLTVTNMTEKIYNIQFCDMIICASTNVNCKNNFETLMHLLFQYTTTCVICKIIISQNWILYIFSVMFVTVNQIRCTCALNCNLSIVIWGRMFNSLKLKYTVWNSKKKQNNFETLMNLFFQYTTT
jgi:hypothetical protein